MDTTLSQILETLYGFTQQVQTLQQQNADLTAENQRLTTELDAAKPDAPPA